MCLKNVHNFKHYLFNWKANIRSLNLIVWNSSTSNYSGEIILPVVYFRIAAVTENLTLTLHFILEVFHLVSSPRVFQLKHCTYFSTRLTGRKSHPSWSNRPNNSRWREITHLFSLNLHQPLAASLLGPCCHSSAISERPKFHNYVKQRIALFIYIYIHTHTHTHAHTKLFREPSALEVSRFRTEW